MMRKSLKKLSLALLSSALLLAITPITLNAQEMTDEFNEEASVAFAEVSSGTCGENLTWVLDENGVLTIEGTGKMEGNPWNSYSDSIFSVVIKSGVTSVSCDAFYFCEYITEVSLPDTLTIIEDYAFGYCEKLEEINLPDGLTEIGCEAFYQCDSLKTITIPGTVKSISKYAFYSCDSLESVVMEEGVQSISDYMFSYCINLQEVNIPASVSSIGEDAFAGCEQLSVFYVDSNNKKYSNDANGVLYNKDKSELVMVPAGFEGNFVIADSVTTIGKHAFYNNDKLTEIAIPATVESIGDDAFSLCGNLTKVDFAYGLVTIGESAFYRCESLKEVVLPESVTEIGAYAFQGCFGLKEVTLPKGLTEIKDYTFSGCRNLDGVIIPDTVERLGTFAFGTSGLTEITIPGSVQRIASCAFGYSEKLKSVVIEHGVGTIKDQAFYECYDLEKIRFLGAPPTFETSSECFLSLTATCYYPKNFKSWTKEIRQDYGGTIKWVSYEGEIYKPEVKTSNLASTGKIKVKWEESGAAKYKVYRATSKDGTYKLMVTTSKTSYTNTSAEAGKAYYYYVKAVDENGKNAKKSKVVSRTCDLARPTVTIKKNSNGKPKLTWEKIAGAKEYKVYRSTSKNGTYSLIKTTTNKSFTNTGAKAGKTYYYKVKAIHKKSAANSAYSKVVSIKSK